MKRFVIILFIISSSNTNYGTDLNKPVHDEISIHTQSEGYEGYLREYDFDSMADEMTEVGYTVSVKPPSKFMYWVRRIGTPVFLKYLDALEFIKKKVVTVKNYRDKWVKVISTYIQVQRRIPGQLRGSRAVGLGVGANGIKVFIS